LEGIDGWFTGFLTEQADALGIPNVADKLTKGLDEVAEEVKTLRTYVKVITPEAAEKITNGPLVGMSFCLTGEMSRPRKDIENDITKAGGEVKSSVAKGLTYLVQADPNSESSKSKKARQYGTTVIGEQELMQMIGV
jgi:NAD-dependent DNA ligase